MRTMATLSLVTLFFFACKKGNQGEVPPPNSNSTGNNLDTTKKETIKTFQVKFSVTGNQVYKFTATHDTIDLQVATPFSGTKDTTLTLKAGSVLHLDSKANTLSLSGAIYVEGARVASGTGTEPGNSGKAMLKLDYTIPK